MRFLCNRARYFVVCGAAGLILVSAGGQIARADVTVVSEVTVKIPVGMPFAPATGMDKPVTSTVYHKNKKQRTESGSTIVITDGDTDTTYALETITKTYTVTKGAGGLSEKASDALMNPMLSQLKITAKTFVHPGNQTQTIAGRETRNTRFMVILKMSMATGDALGAPGGASMAGMLPTVILKGEEWMAEGVLPPGETFAAAGTGFASMTRMMPAFGASFKDFATQIAAVKGFPLASTFSTSIQFPQGAASAMGAAMPKEPFVITTRAKSISNAPLDDALFVIPADYTKLEADPAAPVAPETALPVPAPPADAPPVKPL